MNVLLKPEIEKFVAEKVKAGQYADVSQIINQALEVLKDQETFTPQQEARLRQEVNRGIQQLDQGRCADFTAEKIISEERNRLAEKRNGA